MSKSKKSDVQRKELSKKMNKKNEEWRKDSDYISYVSSGESAAVYIVRDIASDVNTEGMWIDIISFNTYQKRGAEERWAFNWIIAELFPRKLIPEYIDESSGYGERYIREYNRYLTWSTAHKDINRQRRRGYNGPMYLVLCDLVNVNSNKFKVRTIYAKKYWEPQEAYRNMEIKEPVEPEWTYKIREVKKVNHIQVKYIEDNEWEIEEEIRAHGRPTLEILGIE